MIRGVRWTSGLKEALQDEVGYPGGQEQFSGGNDVHGLNEVSGEIGFQDVAKRTCIKDPANHLVRLMHSEDNDFGSRGSVANLTGGLEAVQTGHADVNYGYMGFQLGRFFNGFLTVGGLGDDGKAASNAE